MRVPDWVLQADKQRIAELEKARLSATQVVRPVADSFHTAPGWREVAFELTCIPNQAYPWNPEVIKAIWKFDPTLVPIWVNWVFAPPGKDNERVVFGRHVIGRHEASLRSDLEDFPCTMPSMPCQGITFKKPNVLELVLMMPDNSQFPNVSDLPGDFIAFDWPIVEWLRERFKASQNTQLAKDYINRQRESEEKAKQAMEDDAAYRLRDLQKFVDKKLEQVSEVELRDHILGKKDRQAKPILFLGQ